MKYLKPYREQSDLCNESVKDYLKPKSNEEILKSVEGMKIDKKMLFAIQYNLEWLIDDIINNDKDSDLKTMEKRVILLRSLDLCRPNIVKKLMERWNTSLESSSLLDKYFEISIEKNNLEMFEYLIKLGVNIQTESRDWMVIAVNENNIEMLKILLDRGVSTKFEPDWLRSLVIDDFFTDILKFLSERLPEVKDIIIEEYDKKQKEVKTIQKLL